MQPVMRCIILCLGIMVQALSVQAQEKNTTWSEEELQELFGYCGKPALIQELKISAETADKIGQLFQWSRYQLQKIAANTNDTFATAGEVEEAFLKKCKAFSLSGDQLKALSAIRAQAGSVDACPLAALYHKPAYDTIPQPRMIQLVKTKFRKTLMDQLEVNGKQADMIIEAEVWEQKESQSIAQLAANDFNRVRKTVQLHRDKDRKYAFIGLTDVQKQRAIAFFREKL